MATAFVHDRIFHIGGAEGVFFDLIRKYTTLDQDEKIYTLFSDREEIDIDGYSYEVITALPWWLNKLFVRGSSPTDPDMEVVGEDLVKKLFDYRNLIVFYPQLCRLLRNKIMKTHPDQIVISSFAAVKNIIPYGAMPPDKPASSADRGVEFGKANSGGLGSKGKQKAKNQRPRVILYLHSPNQYIRENHDEYRAKFASRQRMIFDSIVPYLRTWDSKVRAYDHVMTNSQYTSSLVSKYYGLANIEVLYPKLHEKFYTTAPASSPRDYFLYIGRLTTFVREVDKIIELFNTLQLPLIIAGTGPDEEYLKSLAGPTITFVGSVTDIDEKIELIKYARGLINLSLESCGMSTMEALALGVPVFGYNAGGTAELVGPDQGVLVGQKDIESLKKGFEKFLKKFG